MNDNESQKVAPMQTYNADTPVGRQINGILELVAAMENIAISLKSRTAAYSIPLSSDVFVEKASSDDMCGLEMVLFQARLRLEKAAVDIETTMRGLQI